MINLYIYSFLDQGNRSRTRRRQTLGSKSLVVDCYPLSWCEDECDPAIAPPAWVGEQVHRWFSASYPAEEMMHIRATAKNSVGQAEQWGQHQNLLCRISGYFLRVCAKFREITLLAEWNCSSISLKLKEWGRDYWYVMIIC